jgi:peptide-methionine (S)-S-oxide reductase
MSEGSELATFGMGCFWCAEASFSDVVGITSARVGFMGGVTEDPTYEEVCSGNTGHIEVVQIEFDPSVITYQRLLESFWSSHDPSTNREEYGDSGDQYRSVIFYRSPEQRALAEGSKRRAMASGRFRGGVATLILPASFFWLAEEHHQCYLAKLKRPVRHRDR